MRNQAWALEGKRACRKVFFIRGKRQVVLPELSNVVTYKLPHSYSVLPALSLNGFIHCKIVEGSFNTELFTTFIVDLLDNMNPYPEPRSVIIMDNCKIHKAPAIRELIESR